MLGQATASKEGVRVWIRELYIDEFDDGGDLAITQLAAGLNVVRVPSLSAEACLAHFIPTLLYGPLDPQTPVRGGSLVVAQPRPDGELDVLDLCRLRLEGAAGLSELEILTEPDQVANQQRLIETLEAIDRAVYQAVFTDHHPPAQRLAQWRDAVWLVPLLRPAENENRSSAETPSIPLARSSMSEGQVQRSPALGRAAKLCAQQVARWRGLTVDASDIADLRAEGSEPTVLGGAEAIDAARATTDRPGDRQSYFHAKQRCEQLELQITQLRQHLKRLEHIGQLLDGAESRLQQWNELQALQRRWEVPVGEPINARDVKRLRQIRRRLRAIRQRTAQAERRRLASSPGHTDLDTIQTRLARLQDVAAQWLACRDRMQRIEQLQSRLDELAIRHADQQRAEAEIRDAIHDVRHAATELRSARRHADRRRASPDTDPRIDNLRRQVRQLREETHAMLQRQMLSPRVLLGLGLLFSAGAAILGMAMLVNLDGAELAIGSVGLICMFSAALLKSSFERTPTHRLREQRTRIAALCGELRRIRSTDDDIPQATFESIGDAAAAGRPAAMTAGDVEAAERVAAAQRNWRSTAARWNFPVDFDPLAAVRLLRSRAVRVPPGGATLDADLRNRADQIERDRAEVIRWCQKSAAALDQAWNADRAPQEWWDQLQAEQRRLSAQPSAIGASLPTARDGSGGQNERKGLLRQQREILARYGASRPAELRQRLQAQKERAACEAERQGRLERFEASLPSGADGQQIRDWLQNEERLHNARERHRNEFQQTQQQLAAAEQQWAICHADIPRLAAKPAGPSRLPDRANARRAAAEARRQSCSAAQLVRALALSLGGEDNCDEPQGDGSQGDVRLERVEARQPRLLRLASEALQRLSDDPSLTVGWIDPAQGPYIVDGDAEATSCDDLNSAQQALLVMALQLSLVRCLTERVGHLPLVLTDQSTGLPAAAFTRLAALLREWADSGQQVLVITIDPTVSQQFRQLGLPSLVVTRQEPFARRPAIDRSTLADKRPEG